MAAPRAPFRLLNRQPFFARPSIRKRFGPQRRYQTTDAATPQQSFLQRMWNSPVGMKTVHFWAPVMKWSIVLAGVSDFARPASSLSLTQNLALTATGTIWTRWCFVIRPKNMLLAAVNFFLACVGVTQVTRILLYQQSQKGSIEGAVVEEGKEVKESVEGVEEKVKGVVRK